MSPDDPNRRKTELEGSLNQYSKSSRIFGVFVVIGLIIEFVAIVLSFFYEADSRLADAFGLFLVTLGVAGEIRAEFNSHRAERKLRVANEELSEIAETHIRERDERIADLNARTEKLRKKNRQLTILTRDRKLNNPEAFIEAMRSFAGTRVYIQTMKDFGLDPESDHLEEVLRDSLRDALWLVESPVINRLTVRPEPREGVHIEYAALDWYADATPPYITAGCALADWLNKNQIATDIDAPERQRDATVIVRIGPKPSTLGMMNELRWIGNCKRWKGMKRPQEYEPISPKDVQTIRDLLAQANRPEGRFLTAVGGARSIEDIRKRDLQRAIWLLESILRDRPKQ